MNIQVTEKPHMLLEAVELLYAYINHIPAAELTMQRENCLPVEAVQEMMDVACAGISREDEAYRYYFAMHRMPDEGHGSTCMARTLVYMVVSQYDGSMEETCNMMKLYWHRELREREVLSSVGTFAPWFEPRDSTMTMQESIVRLNMDEDYIRKLQEQFSDYDAAIDNLHRLIAPVAEKLEPLLMPWVAPAAEQARLWRENLSVPGAEERFLQMLFVRYTEKIDRISIQLRYLDPYSASGTIVNTESDQWEVQERYIFIHLGLYFHPEGEQGQELELFHSWEFRAMRLLGSPVRLRMLHTLWDKSMSSRELAKALNLNLGTLCRDMNSLYECKLLILESGNERRRYRTNRETMAYLAKHLADFGELQLSEE